MGKIKEILEQSDRICGRFVSPGAFLVAGNADEDNVMTIGWGFIGYAWNRPVCAVMVRDSRFTQRLMDANDEFTVCLPFSGMNSQLGKAGSLSGRDGDKWSRCGLEKAKARAVATPVVAMEDGLVVECRKVACVDLKDGFVHADIMAGVYADNDTHKIYYGEIIEAY